MTVYIEYAFLENALLDGCLLFFALRYSGCVRTYRILLSAIVGGVVAVVFPLISLPTIFLVAYKLCAGVTLPLLAMKKEGKSKATLCVILFFAFSFLVAGGVFAFASFAPVGGGYYIHGIPLSLLSSLLFSAFAFLAESVKKIKRRREKTDFFVDCVLCGKGEVQAKGFVDTGNQIRHFGLPVCFVTPTLFAEIHTDGKVGSATVLTVAGSKKIPVVKMRKLRITAGGQTHIINGVYLSPSATLCGREYEVLLGAWAWN